MGLFLREGRSVVWLDLPARFSVGYLVGDPVVVSVLEKLSYVLSVSFGETELYPGTTQTTQKWPEFQRALSPMA